MQMEKALPVGLLDPPAGTIEQIHVEQPGIHVEQPGIHVEQAMETNEGVTSITTDDGQVYMMVDSENMIPLDNVSSIATAEGEAAVQYVMVQQEDGESNLVPEYLFQPDLQNVVIANDIPATEPDSENLTDGLENLTDAELLTKIGEQTAKSAMLKARFEHLETLKTQGPSGVPELEESGRVRKQAKKMLQDGNLLMNCGLCQAAFTNVKDLSLHRLTHTGDQSFSCVFCGKKFASKRYMDLHMICHSEHRPHTCAVCGKSFQRAADMRRHRDNHSTNMCQTCGMNFLSRRDLNKHIMIAHQDVGAATCTLCQNVFINQQALRKHKREVHATRYPCGICGRSFSHKSTLSYHRRLHKEGAAFSCPVCLKKFVRKDYLEKHVQHLGDLPVGCTICHRHFADVALFEAHQILHTTKPLPQKEGRVRCIYCSKLFNKGWYFNKHLAMHGGTGFHCKECSKKFATQADLKRHEQMHATLGTFTCDICGKVFKRNYNLVSHRELMHPDD